MINSKFVYYYKLIEHMVEANQEPETTLVMVDELDLLAIKELQQYHARKNRHACFFQDTLATGHAGAELAVIPAGRFEMGSPAHELGHSRTEYPQHLVSLPKAFALGRFPVTASEFEHFRTDTEWQLRPELVWHKGSCPVVNVRMEDIRLYLKWLSQQTGHIYRLPTEAEWEFAARAGTRTPFYHGHSVSCKDVHFNPAFPYQEALEKRRWYLPRCFPSRQASEVGLLTPNAWGLYDMHGNVWEFTSSHWTNSHLGAHRDGSPSANASPDWYVTKGGSWFDPAAQARSAARKQRYLDELDVNLGFRVLREL